MRRSGGFTLIELLTAVAIFAILMGMLFQMIRGSLDVWRMGEGERESLEKGTVLLEEISEDLRMVFADSPAGSVNAPVRMLSDYGQFDLDLDLKLESTLQRLRFVRACPEERFDRRLRRAGSVPGGTAFSSDMLTSSAEARAPGGLAEVAYATLRLAEKGSDPALLSLYRLFRTPIGGAGSLFENQLFDQPKKLELEGIPLADNVLYLGFEFWSRDTVSWNDAPDLETGPLTVWDSTRALLLERGNLNSFLLARGADSLERTDDDVFPRRVRVTLVLARDEDEATTAQLTSSVGTVAKTLSVNNMKLFGGGERVHPYLKVGGEWMRWKRGSGNELIVIRGQRRTGNLPHDAGARVHVGRTFERVVEIPVYREDWNDK
ncbi:MAG: prepilin-type N-terminal cleavage/methylation domain-containing protein [Planctomycetota bacterium]